MALYAYWVRGTEFRDMARESAKSVRKVDPEAQIDIRVDTGSRPMMVANLDAQIDVLSSVDHGTKVLFLDADTVVRKPFPFGDEQLYVTWRDHVAVRDGEKVEGIASLMPYNYGVVGVIACPVVTEAFYWLRARILNMSGKHQDWYGNQLALAALAAGVPESGVAERAISWSFSDTGTPIRIRYLPCQQWNFTPEAEGEDVSDKGIIHAKGNRKSLLKHYARSV